jgi:hypothetical protein
VQLFFMIRFCSSDKRRWLFIIKILKRIIMKTHLFSIGFLLLSDFTIAQNSYGLSPIGVEKFIVR